MEILAALLSFAILVTPQVFDHPYFPYVKIRPEVFIWKAEKEYTYFAKGFHDGDLIFTGRKERVLAMIAQFKYPVERLVWKDGISATNRSIKAKCVSKLERIPIMLNYQECNTASLE